MSLGLWREPETGEPLDEVQIAAYHAPNSYTGENLCEIFCHGGRAATEALLRSCIAAGARLAEAGEFSRRAYLNGRMDLTQAEAVCDLITASTEAARRLALQQVRGGVSHAVEKLRERLIQVAAEIEARLDFNDEDIGQTDRNRLQTEMKALINELNSSIHKSTRGRIAREGARIAICGKPNTGKSSLLNALAGRERALVTPHAGTTRDTIECSLDVCGFEMTFIDTAGIRETHDEVERLGVEAAKREIADADLTLWMLDVSQPLDEEDRLLGRELASVDTLRIRNKIDLQECWKNDSLKTLAPDVTGYVVDISAQTGKGLDRLESILIACTAGEGTPLKENGLLVGNIRHIDRLRQTRNAAVRAYEHYIQDASGEFIMIDLNEAIAALSAILGLEVREIVLDRIFSQFCIGK